MDGPVLRSAPEVSVVVPTYRRPQLLARLVGALEAQTFPASRFEVMIVDNGSRDATAGVLAGLASGSSLQIRCLRIEVNRGPAVARNLGWRSARGPLVAFLDDDCVPDPGWLQAGVAALRSGPQVGVVQGWTGKPADARHRDWNLVREIAGPTPFFEACNIFYRRAALEAGGGFDEAIGWWGEDTALGWAVLAAEWRRGFDVGAVVRHDVVDRGVAWHIRAGYLEGNLVGIAARFPRFRREGWWRPWAFRRENAAFALALAGMAATPWFRPAAALALPYVHLRRPPRDHPRFFRHAAERVAVDSAVFVGMKVAAARHRLWVL